MRIKQSIEPGERVPKQPLSSRLFHHLLPSVHCSIQSDGHREPASFRVNGGAETIETVEALAPLVTLFGRLERQSSAQRNSPFFSKLPDDLLGRQIQVNLCSRQPIMVEEPLQGRQRDVLLHRRHRNGSCVSYRRERHLIFSEDATPYDLSARGFAT
jgi:hypothetical protein